MMAGRQTIDLPDKVYFRIGEVARALDLRPHVVRFWQKEFPSIRPERSRSGRFLYTRTTVEHIALIRRLLHEEGYTIQGARKAIRDRSRARTSSSSPGGGESTETAATAEGDGPQAASGSAPADAARIAELEAALAQSGDEQKAALARLQVLQARHEKLCETICKQGGQMLALLGESGD